jgi:uncharacterized protein YkuJ
MSIVEIKKMLSTLVEYEDSMITYTLSGLIDVVYSKVSQGFQITTVVDGKVLHYDDIDAASEALYIILNPKLHKTCSRKQEKCEPVQ